MTYTITADQLASIKASRLQHLDNGDEAAADALGWVLTAEPSGWRPIETAPKDGTEILLGSPGRSTQGHWLMPSDKPTIRYRDGFAPEEEWEEFEPFWMSWDGGFTEEYPPTAWQPLPQPPEA